VIHKTHKESPLSNQDRALSLKPVHEDPFAITCKTSKQTKNKNKPEKNFFSTLETPHLQQFSQRPELRFSTFLHKKRLTLFLGHTIHNVFCLNLG
jgi:hypothetical protein